MKTHFKNHANPLTTLIMVAAMAFTSIASEDKQPDVYVAGYEKNAKGRNVATLWINGEARSLADVNINSSANSVYIAGNDVYVAGYEEDSIRTATLWKNGVAQRLTDDSTWVAVAASSVYVSGKDVYVAGLGYENKQEINVAMLWKNGVVQRPTDGSAGERISSIYVSGKDMYIAGYGKRVAKLWKNGIAQDLTDGNRNAAAYSVYVSGNDVYVAGEEGGSARLWKNGVVQRLEQRLDGKTEGKASSVYVSGKDVYVAGYEMYKYMYKRVATLWKNGVVQRLTDGSFGAEASSVYVSGNDVYVTGYEKNEQKKDVLKLWKNGVAQDLTDGNSSQVLASSVFVSSNKTAKKQIMEATEAATTKAKQMAAEAAATPEEKAAAKRIAAEKMFGIALTPSESDDSEFVRFFDASKGEEANGADSYISDPNGPYYHFRESMLDWGGMRFKSEFTASSKLAPQGKTRYDASNLQNGTYGGDRSIAWCEGVKGHGIGERINMRIKTGEEYGKVDLYEIMIVNGYAKNQTTFNNNARAKTLRLYVSGKHLADLHLKDVIKPQVFSIPGPLVIEPHISGKKIAGRDGAYYQTDLSFEIKEVYPGEKYDDTCITGVELIGYSSVYSGGLCFAAGTKILMKDNSQKNIESIKEGDWVKSYDFKNKKLIDSKVTKLVSAPHSNLLKLKFAGNEIIATTDHPFWIERNVWAAADAEKANRDYVQKAKVEKLKIGDKVFMPEKNVFMEILGMETIDKQQTTYTIELSEGDNFIANGMLVKTETLGGSL